MSTEDLDELERLKNAPLVTDLENHRPAVTFLRALALDRSELHHSRVLAFLFDPDQSPASADELARGLLGRSPRSCPVPIPTFPDE